MQFVVRRSLSWQNLGHEVYRQRIVSHTVKIRPLQVLGHFRHYNMIHTLKLSTAARCHAGINSDPPVPLEEHTHDDGRLEFYSETLIVVLHNLRGCQYSSISFRVVLVGCGVVCREGDDKT